MNSLQDRSRGGKIAVFSDPERFQDKSIARKKNPELDHRLVLGGTKMACNEVLHIFPIRAPKGYLEHMK